MISSRVRYDSCLALSTFWLYQSWMNENCYLPIRVGFFSVQNLFLPDKMEKKLDKTCFVQFLPSKTVQNWPKLDEIMNILLKMLI